MKILHSSGEVCSYTTVGEMVKNLNEYELTLFEQTGLSGFIMLMDMWASHVDGSFDEWYDRTHELNREYAIELSNKSIAMYRNND